MFLSRRDAFFIAFRPLSGKQLKKILCVLCGENKILRNRILEYMYLDIIFVKLLAPVFTENCGLEAATFTKPQIHVLANR